MGGSTFVEAEIWTVAQTDQGNVVLIRPKASDIAVPIFIGQLETQSILIGMGAIEVPRPLTHDLMLSLLSALKADLSRIEIYDLREGTFYAHLILKTPGGELYIDARPSDAIGLAVRSLCPVFISETVVEEAGISVNLVMGAQDQSDILNLQRPDASPENPGGEGAKTQGLGSLSQASSEARIESLHEQLEAAIMREDYESAATIRDKLRELES